MVNLRNYSNSSDRRQAIEQELNLQLTNIGNFSMNEEIASTRNCENMIGALQIPIGIAGPLQIHATNTFETYIPLATTEGALVASVNRGCKAVTLSGGVRVLSEKIGITRAPVFKTKDLLESKQLVEWVDSHLKELKEKTDKTSSHLHLLEIKPWIQGRNVFLRFRFDTEDAMGMNMATIAVSAVVSFIEQETKSKCIALSGNMCVDKKPNFLNFIEGRGYKTQAEACIPKTILKDVLKTDANSILEVYNRKIIMGSILSGSIGANAHFSNILAAMFLATGQDIAHVAESSMGVTSVEKDGEDLYISALLPDLPIGTVGGGTQLETQKEAISILNLGTTKTQNLAAVVSGAVLAGELSLLASLAANSLACAHETLGRGKAT